MDDDRRKFDDLAGFLDFEAQRTFAVCREHAARFTSESRLRFVRRDGPNDQAPSGAAESDGTRLGRRPFCARLVIAPHGLNSVAPLGLDFLKIDPVPTAGAVGHDLPPPTGAGSRAFDRGPLRVSSHACSMGTDVSP